MITFGRHFFCDGDRYHLVVVQQEQLERKQIELDALKNKYEKFDQFYELVSLLAEFNSKDQKAVTIRHDTNYLEKTLKDKKEEVLVLNIKPEYMSDCAKDDQQCYRDPKTKDRRAYSGFYKASDGSFVISLKKRL